MAQGQPSFWKSAAVRVVTLVLLAQAVAFYAFSRTEYVPDTPPLALFPTDIAGWHLAEEGVVEQEVRDVLQADDLLNRLYSHPSAVPVNLFIAAFRSQRNGKTPHSPKNCLPGSGWVQMVNDRIPIDFPGVGTQLVNHYVVSKGDARSVVLYWYQSRDRIVASEYKAKFYVVADSMRFNRSDTALVRIVAPVINGQQELADQNAVEFARAAFPALRNALPH